MALPIFLCYEISRKSVCTGQVNVITPILQRRKWRHVERLGGLSKVIGSWGQGPEIELRSPVSHQTILCKKKDEKLVLFLT